MRLWILGLALLAVGPSWAGDVTVKDGVTIAVDGATFRLDGIDAPEADQFCLNEKGAVSRCGIEARDRLKTLLAGRAVHCEDKGPDPVYPKRRIGVCRIDGDATTLNQWLVRQGWAVKFEPYAKGRFAADEDEAKASRAGLWKGCFAIPQDLRRWNKSTAKLLGASCSMIRDIDARNALFPDDPSMPPDCSIKGKFAVRAKLTGHRGIYHLESCGSYQRTKKPERWFCSEEDAQAAGFRKALTCRS
jgi:endonuclease YncB( thermonuclease family)